MFHHLAPLGPTAPLTPVHMAGLLFGASLSPGHIRILLRRQSLT
jgi:hypothetical protein